MMSFPAFRGNWAATRRTGSSRSCQSREAYRKTTDAAEWSGGQFDGRIRVPVLDRQGMDAPMRHVLAHEVTHACLAMLGSWPAWFQEGLAQKLSGDALAPAWRQKLAEMARLLTVPRLTNLRPGLVAGSTRNTPPPPMRSRSRRSRCYTRLTASTESRIWSGILKGLRR